jgi:hypothetical protein
MALFVGFGYAILLSRKHPGRHSAALYATELRPHIYLSSAGPPNPRPCLMIVACPSDIGLMSSPAAPRAIFEELSKLIHDDEQFGPIYLRSR